MSTPGQDRQSELIEGPAGSPVEGEPVFLVVGKLRRPHGLRGDILMEVITDFPDRLHPQVSVYVGDELRLCCIRSLRWHGTLMLIAFEEFNDRESVGVLRNQLVYVRADDRPPLPEGEYYHHQLLGFRVLGDDGQLIGRLTQILETGANDVYIVQPPDGREILLPAIEDVILDIDLVQGEIRVNLLPGLMPE
jgi:16S rRNA processing protein RimM